MKQSGPRRIGSGEAGDEIGDVQGYPYLTRRAVRNTVSRRSFGVIRYLPGEWLGLSHATAKAFITSSPRWLIAFTAMRLGHDQRLSQFSSRRPDTCSNSRMLAVTSVAPSAKACAAIQRSFGLIGVPAISSSARRRA